MPITFKIKMVSGNPLPYSTYVLQIVIHTVFTYYI